MKTLLARLGLPEEHLLPSDFEDGTRIKPFVSKLDVARLNELRATSEQFLKMALA